MAKVPPDLTGVRLKLDRADEHIQCLRRETKAFLKRDPAPLSIRTEKTTGPGKVEQHVVYAVIREGPPARLGLIAGDAIQNTRHALDYLVYELSSPSARSRGKTLFPIFDDECRFKVLGPSYIKGIKGDELTLIQTLQPYHAANPARDPLAVLNRLANKDKHKLLIATAAATAETDTWIGTTNAQLRITYFRGGPVEHDAKILAFTATPKDPSSEMYAKPESGLEIQLKETDIQPGGGPNIEICDFISYLRFYVENTVIDAWFKWGYMPPKPT